MSAVEHHYHYIHPRMTTPMAVVISVFLWLTLSVPILCYPDQWLHQIYVDSQTGVNDSSCWEGGYSTPCLSLNMALKGAQHYNHSTAILLQPGQHHLHSGEETQLRNVFQLAIVGNVSEGEVVISCGPLAGLGFFWSEDVELTSVSLIGCGAVQNSTSKNATTSTVEFIQIEVAIYFWDCKDITLTHVLIDESTGTGVVLYDAMGVVDIDRCYFSCSGQSLVQDSLYGGGGLVIEVNKESSQSLFAVTNSTFENNTASRGEFPSLSLNTNPSGYFGLGRGGGLSVVFRQGAVNNIVQLNKVEVKSNRAQFGGGVFLAFYDNSSNNTVTIDKSEVTRNEATLLTSTVSKSTVGGGVLITFVATEANWPVNNTVTIVNNNFTSNKAEAGGGIAVLTSINFQCSCLSTSNKLLIDQCAFDKNEAFQGSSAYFSQDSISCRHQLLVETTVCSSSFTNGDCGTTLKSFILPCSGNMLLQAFSLLIDRTTTFIGNQQSALKLRFSSIQLLPSTQLHFINNSAFKGAALHLVDCSSVIVNNSTALLFANNTATNRGGAIYAEDCSVFDTGGRQCFIRHTNSSLHPNDWETTFTFKENQASLTPNSIYVNSIRSCIWPDSDSLVSDPNNTFCWRGWSYENSSRSEENCLHQLKSGPASVNTSGSSRTLFPGETINLQVTVYDDWGRDITDETSLHVRVIIGPTYIKAGRNSYGWPMTPSNSITLSPADQQVVTLWTDCSTGYSEQNSLLSISPPHDQFPETYINIYFKSCEEAVSWNGSYCSSSEGCKIIFSQYCGIPFLFKQSQCQSIDPITNNLTTGLCPLSYQSKFCSKNNFIMPFRNLVNMYRNTSTLTCAPHREGRLCGRCAEGYGVAINNPDFTCTECESYYGVAIYLFLELLPVLIMMIILIVLHINITDGYLNGFILYSQLVTLHYPGLGYSAWLPNHGFYYGLVQQSHNNFIPGVPLTVYSIWNLNFLTLDPVPFCTPIAKTAVGALVLQYLIAACPLLFIAVTYTWIQLYSHGYRSVVYITRPVHQVLARFWQMFRIQPSLIDSYAGLILLSYMRFIDISFKLLQHTTIFFPNRNQTAVAFYYDANLDYFGWPHGVCGVLAITCLLEFVLLPLTVLLFYHLKIFQKCLSWCKLDRPGLHALVDAYQGCFKNSATDGVERRYFAGIYLLFRLLAVIVLISFSFDLLACLITQACLSLLSAGIIVLLRPYKKTAHNIIDFLLLFFMTLLAAMSIVDTSTVLIISVVYLPFIVLCSCLTYHFVKYSCGIVKCKRSRRAQTTTVNVDPSELSLPPVTHSEIVVADHIYVPDDLYADRILNPSGYEEEHTQYLPVDETAKTSQQ